MFKLFKNNSNRTQAVTTRVVKTSRWVHRDELKVGMYVRELDCPWESTSFMFQGFIVDNLNLLQEVQAAAEYINITSEKLVAMSSTSTNRLCGSRGV